MAQVLKLRRDGVDTNLLSSSGWFLTDPGWVPKVGEAEEGQLPPPVEEALQIQSNFSSQDNLAAAVILLNKLRHDARRYMKDRTEQEPVWLHDKLNDETGTRRALVRRIGLTPLVEQHGVGDERGSMIDAKPVYEVGIEREAYWERTARVGPGDGNVDGLGGVFDYTSGSSGVDIVGDSPARIEQLFFQTNIASTLDAIWLGFRSANKHGTLANFEPLWEAEDASTSSVDTTATGDGTASGSSMMRCDFSTSADWLKRVTIYLGDVTSDYGDNFGRFVVLLRAKVTGTAVAHVRMKSFYRSDTNSVIVGSTEEVSATSWTLHNLGLVQIPLRDLHALGSSIVHVNYSQKQAIAIDAKRASGSGNLDMDCLVLIPADEYFFHGTNLDLKSTTRFYIGMAPEGQTYAYTRDSTVPEASAIVRPNVEGPGIPVGDGRIYVAVARASNVNVVADMVQASMYWFPRWLALRGTE